MQIPNPKRVPIYVPQFLTFGIGLGLAFLYDGKVYDDFSGVCQRCGSRNCVKHGFEDGHFVRLICDGDNSVGGSSDEHFVDIDVRRQVYFCKNCGATYTSMGPFYDGAMYGVPIVDLALMLSMDNSAYGVERAMMNLGIQLDSDTVLDYIRLYADRCRERASLTNGSLYGINLLKVLFGVNNARELAEKFPKIDLQSLMDETYPEKKGALKKFLEMIKSAERSRVVNRGLNGKEIVVKDGEVVFPDSFTLALSYLPGAEAFASLICTPQPFNQLLAEILFKALEGSSSTVTDGSRNYEEIKNRIGCVLHKTKNELKRDSKFKELRKEVRQLKERQKEAKSEEEKQEVAMERAEKVREISSYAKARYQEVVNSTLDKLRNEHPALFDKDGKFNGHLTTNGMEGGNWRIKYAMRVPYARSDSAAGRSILAAIRDSIFTIRGGKVRESLANRLNFFSFGRVMGAV